MLINRAIQETYPPGSTFKLIDTAAALASAATPRTASSPRRRPSPCQAPAPTWRTSTATPAAPGETASLRDALQRSCNTAFAQLAGELGRAGHPGPGRRVRHRHGDLTIPMPVSAVDASGDIPDTAALQQSSIGQRDVALTPLQNAMVVAAIANGGEVMAPYLVKEIQSQELDPVETTEPDRLGRAIDSSVAATLTELMINNENSYARQRQAHRRADRVQDRHRRARGHAEEHPAARLVRGVRAGRGARGRGGRARRVRRRPHTWRPPAAPWPPRSAAP